jgi:hypothetical protein
MDEPRQLPTGKQQSWGALLSIIVIMLMIVVGASYAWHKSAADERALKDLSKGAGGETVTYATTTATTTPN